MEDGKDRVQPERDNRACRLPRFSIQTLARALRIVL